MKVPAFCLWLTMARHLGFKKKFGLHEADGCSPTPPGAMLRRPFRYYRSFMYAAVSDISYIVESVASWENKSGSVTKLSASSIRFGYCALCSISAQMTIPVGTAPVPLILVLLHLHLLAIVIFVSQGILGSLKTSCLLLTLCGTHRGV